MQYRRARVEGGTYFFTVVTHLRRGFLCETENVDALRRAFRSVRAEHPFQIDAIVVLPEHLHCVWTLPPNDLDFSMRWRLVKTRFSRSPCARARGTSSVSRHSKKEADIWQRRFWEHWVRDERDLIRHVEYIHYNPVKHGLARAPKEWKHTSFHRYVREGRYDADWGAGELLEFPASVGRE